MIIRLLGDRLYQPYPLPAKTDGVPTTQLVSWLINADSRLWLLEQLPEQLRTLLNERAVSTDVVEAIFGIAVLVCGYKPARRVMQGMAKNVEWAAQLKATPDEQRGFLVAGSKADAWYERAPNEAASSVRMQGGPGGVQYSSDWNDGRALVDGSMAASRTDKMNAVADKKALGRAVRDFYKK